MDTEVVATHRGVVDVHAHSAVSHPVRWLVHTQDLLHQEMEGVPSHLSC
jgi:hypothetical protein